MGENDPLTPKLGMLRVECAVVEMAGDLLVEEVALAHEQIGAAGRVDQPVGPLGFSDRGPGAGDSLQ